MALDFLHHAFGYDYKSPPQKKKESWWVSDRCSDWSGVETCRPDRHTLCCQMLRCPPIIRSVCNLLHQARMFRDLGSKFRLWSCVILFNVSQVFFIYRDMMKLKSQNRPYSSLPTVHWCSTSIQHTTVIRAGACSVPRLISGPDYAKLFHGGRNM